MLRSIQILTIECAWEQSADDNILNTWGAP
jgi:hypothetical protein